MLIIPSKPEFETQNLDLSWRADVPIDGIRLNASGYDADGACSDDRCWWVSMNEKPDVTATSYNAQMPTTGAPTGNTSIGLLAIGLGVIGIAFALIRRQRI